MRGGAPLFAAAGLALTLAAPLSSERADDRTAARDFAEGARLMSLGPSRYLEACTAFERALALGSGVGTKFNLADCYDKTRRPARALRLFREVEDITRQAGQKERSDAARERADEVLRRVPRVAIEARWLAAHPEAVLSIDDEPLPRALATAPVTVDFGKHAIVARLAGDESRVNVDLETDHQLARVIIPLPAAAAAPPAADVTSAKQADPTQRDVGWIVGGVGVAAAIVGGSVTLAARLRYNSVHSTDGCTSANVCTSSSAPSAIDGTRTEANVGGVTAIVGLVLAAAGVTLWATAPRSPVSVEPSVGFDHASVVARGSF